MTTSQPLLADGLSRIFSGRAVVDQASLTLAPGEVTALIGPSGSGKTTLLRMLAGMERPDQGAVRSGDKILSENSRFVPVEKRRIGLVFQDFALFPHLNVLGNVMFGLQAIPKPEREARAQAWIERLGLGHRRDAYPHHLSGGEQQRTAIARALAPEPVAILLDEPFSGLDPTMRDQVRETALEAVRSANIPALLVTHDASEALVHADKIAVIGDGQILQTGKPEEVYRAPKTLSVARALGPMHSIKTSLLPTAWQETLKSKADTLWYRPEAFQIGAGEPCTVSRIQMAGPITEIALNLGESGEILAACQPGRPIQAGDRVEITLNPDLVFDFPSETT
ncbi:MAG: ABC transporter ATP-binding protein [Pseudomonadota bacterium]